MNRPLYYEYYCFIGGGLEIRSLHRQSFSQEKELCVCTVYTILYGCGCLRANSLNDQGSSVGSEALLLPPSRLFPSIRLCQRTRHSLSLAWLAALARWQCLARLANSKSGRTHARPHFQTIIIICIRILLTLQRSFVWVLARARCVELSATRVQCPNGNVTQGAILMTQLLQRTPAAAMHYAFAQQCSTANNRYIFLRLTCLGVKSRHLIVSLYEWCT